MVVVSPFITKLEGSARPNSDYQTRDSLDKVRPLCLPAGCHAKLIPAGAESSCPPSILKLFSVWHMTSGRGIMYSSNKDHFSVQTPAFVFCCFWNDYIVCKSSVIAKWKFRLNLLLKKYIFNQQHPFLHLKHDSHLNIIYTTNCACYYTIPLPMTVIQSYGKTDPNIPACVIESTSHMTESEIVPNSGTWLPFCSIYSRSINVDTQ